MPSARRTRRPRSAPPAGLSYWSTARRPLQILVFLLPLILAYEIALAFYLQSEDNVRTVLAHSYLLKFFDLFDIAPQGGLHLGGFAIVAVLLVWHILNREKWIIDWAAVGLMAVETILLTLPLLVIGQVVGPPSPAAWGPAGTGSLDGLDIWSMMAISIGAGLYEELVFRMMLIAVIHTLLVDLGRASHRIGAGIAVAVSAAAFAAYHPLTSSGGGLEWSRLAFYLLAGLFFGTIYVVRGFGVVVGVHALYDITVSILSGPDIP